MILTSSDPDVATIFNRITSGEWNLQPDFQRGEVWSRQKKQRLIDTIIRGWHIPPIHLVLQDDGTLDVLDGQQRLVAIREFMSDELPLLGSFLPYDSDLEFLDGMRFSGLPEPLKRKFSRFSIRLLTITDYSPEEPGELFFRLNQPTNLTTAEQRNAFFGPVRKQVKQLIERYESNVLNDRFLGFSNSRMSYDDVIARVSKSLMNGDLREKVTAASVEGLYRSEEGIPPDILERIEGSLTCLDSVSKWARDYGNGYARIRFNKATLSSWLYFFAELGPVNKSQTFYNEAGGFVWHFESARTLFRKAGLYRPSSYDPHVMGFFNVSPEYLAELLHVFIDRSTSRVADVSSVIARNRVLWLCALDSPFAEQLAMNGPPKKVLGTRRASSQLGDLPNELIAEYLTDYSLERVKWDNPQ